MALKMTDAGRRAVTVAVSPLAELLACLHILAEPDHHPEARTWLEGVRARLPDALRSDLLRFAPLWARYRVRFLYPLAPAADRSLADELSDIATLDDDVFVPLAANAIRGLTFADVGAPGCARRVQEAVDWVRDCERRSFVRGDLANALAADPRRFRADLVAVLRECATGFFADEWERTGRLLAAAAESLRARLAEAPVLEVLAGISDMASSRGSADTVFFDKLQSAHRAVGAEGVILFPSVRAWPHLTIKLDDGLPVTIPFLVQEQERGGSGRSQADIRQRLMVLAEPARWEMCRHLIGEAITTNELADRLGTTKYAVSRHLRVMREAGLISSQRSGRQVFHRMNPTAIARLGFEALRSIMR